MYMLNRAQHEKIMGQILFDIYTHPELRSVLGFKGGTACYFLYNLPRFSTDLDFNLLDIAMSERVFELLTEIVKKYGTLKDAYQKSYTIFFLLSYETRSHNIKIEISKRIFERNTYHVQYYTGLPILVLDKPFLAAHKLVAILDRKKIVNRDLFDAHYFLKEQWPIDEETIRIRTGKNLPEYFEAVAATLKQYGSAYILDGIGDLITEEQKRWVKPRLLQELTFYLRNHADIARRHAAAE